MDSPLLVVVTGPPAAGKTTVARALAAHLAVPLVAKDTIKEALFDGLGTGDLAWSKRLGEATYLALLAIAGESVAAGANLVLEANFVRGSKVEAQLAALPARFVQVHCTAPLDVLVERYGNRRRHPGARGLGADRGPARGSRVGPPRPATPPRRHDPSGHDRAGRHRRSSEPPPRPVTSTVKKLQRRRGARGS